tara:strand:+ start:1247 stop:1570 length:324 start_codon:yes stop_codon:yes gene_type:complete
MRIKLSYTVEEDTVLAEAAKIINLAGDDMQEAIQLFNSTQAALRGENNESENINVDVHRSVQLIDEFRKALLNIDTRLSEVVEIVEAYGEYQREQRSPPPRAKATKE